MIITIHHPLVFAFGLLGNIISFMVFLAPVPTFIRIFKKKSTEGFQSVPYVVALFSAMLWIYYAMLKGNSILLITINVAGVIIEIIYVAIYITYAPRQARVSTLKLLFLMNLVGFSLIVLLCHYLVIKAHVRLQVYGWICVVFSISVFAAPLSVMRMVIRTKSAEFMPINLSLCLTLTATIWFLYGFLLKDLYITLPNVVGFLFGVAQMVLYGIYRKYDKQKLPEVVSPVKNQQTVDIAFINSFPNQTDNENTISPHQVLEEIEVVTNETIHNNDGNVDILDHENNLYAPPQGPSTCNVDVERIVGVPIGLAPVQLVQCAV